VSNDSTTLTVAPPWNAQPDSTSYFAVAESGWKFGALSKTSPVEFAIPNRSGETVQISGRAANVNDQECAAELSTVTRWQIGGCGGEGGDVDVPPAPYFGLSAIGRGGIVELSGVSFTELTNTRTISSATLTIYYRDELVDATGTLAGPLGEADNVVLWNAAGKALAGDFLQLGGEVMRVEEAQDGGTQYRVTRAMHGTAARANAAGSPIYALVRKTAIAPFPADFFGSPYSGGWTFPMTLPDARIASAELFVTNRKGNSATRAIHLTNNDDLGLRTLSGGQYCIQVSGFLAVDGSAAPPLVIEASHGVRDIYAVLGTAADASVTVELLVNGAPYCTLTFPAGTTVSDATDGSALPPLHAKDQVTVGVLSVGKVQPGSDLTVLIRL
jgi:hypothetical protein